MATPHGRDFAQSAGVMCTRMQSKHKSEQTNRNTNGNIDFDAVQ